MLGKEWLGIYIRFDISWVSWYWLQQAPDLVISGLYTMWCYPVPDTSVQPLLPAKATLPAGGYCVPFWCLGHHTWCRFGSDRVTMESRAVWSCYWASGPLSCCINAFACLNVSGCFHLRVRMYNRYTNGGPIEMEGCSQRTMTYRLIKEHSVPEQSLFKFSGFLLFILGSGSFLLGGKCVVSGWSAYFPL